jgi:hypothetical protein
LAEVCSLHYGLENDEMRIDDFFNPFYCIPESSETIAGYKVYATANGDK